MKLKLQEKLWIGTYILLWMIVSTVSTIHSVEFFKLSNSIILSWFLALSFELGAIASLGGLLISRGSKTLIWMLFILLTAFQVHCNMYWCWINAKDLTEWIHLLSLIDEDHDIQRRIFTVISGGILPIVALGFMKSLMDYLNPNKLDDDVPEIIEDDLLKNVIESYDYNNSKHFTPDFDPNIEVDVSEHEITAYDDGDDIIIDEHKLMTVDEIMDQDDIHNDETSEAEELAGWNDIVKEEHIDLTDKPFWSNLNPKKILKLLSSSGDKIQNELPKGNNEK